MNFDILKGKRFWLFVILSVIGALQAIQPMVSDQWVGVVTAILSMLGILKTFFPYEKESGTIDTTGLGK